MVSNQSADPVVYPHALAVGALLLRHASVLAR
jgi:hypothetical protein